MVTHFRERGMSLSEGGPELSSSNIEVATDKSESHMRSL